MIPNFQQFMRPVLESVLDGPRKISDVVEEVAQEFNLSEEEKNQLLPSGTQTTIANRTHWAKSYLKQAGLVRNLGGGRFEITERGREVAQEKSITINKNFLKQFDEFQEFQSRTKDNAERSDIDDMLEENTTPDESLEDAHKRLNDALAANLLDAVRSSSPAFFEELVVKLFVAMGYGGSEESAGRRLGQSGDNGVDG